MRLLLRTLLRKSTGDVAARDATLTGTPIRIGRGADCEIHLGDPRVLLAHASLEKRAGAVFIEAAGEGALDFNGTPSRVAMLATGDVVRLGPYELCVIASPDDTHDFALSCELVSPLEGGADALAARSTLTLAAAGLHPRRWSWAMALLILAVFVGWPLAGHFLSEPTRTLGGKPAAHPVLAAGQSLWQAGPLSGPHRFIGDNCTTCHSRPFVRVEAQACLSCHKTASEHADTARFPFAAIAGRRCQSCHKEHEGEGELTMAGEAFCTGCHAGLKQTVQGRTALADVAALESHPPFRFEKALAPKPGLTFSHETHLDPAGINDPDTGRKRLVCSNCHTASGGGAVMTMPRFETACAGCHALRFEPAVPDRVMPHGAAEAAKQFVRDTYANLALQGSFPAKASDAPAVMRRRPGEPVIAAPERMEARGWAEARAAEVIGGRFGKGLCGECHALKEMPGDPLGWTVAPVRPEPARLRAGKFDHRPHRDVSCTACHAAPKSDSASDLLLPGVATCKSCHGGPAAAQRISMGCTDCHDFHRPHGGVARK